MIYYRPAGNRSLLAEIIYHRLARSRSQLTSSIDISKSSFVSIVIIFWYYKYKKVTYKVRNLSLRYLRFIKDLR